MTPTHQFETKAKRERRAKSETRAKREEERVHTVHSARDPVVAVRVAHRTVAGEVVTCKQRAEREGKRKDRQRTDRKKEKTKK